MLNSQDKEHKKNKEENKEDNEEKLFPYQIPHKFQLLEALGVNSRILDASDTGTGKTYITISLCRDLGLRPFVICPKAVIPVWADVCKLFDVNYFGISNYEMLKNCKYYTENFEPAQCPYMDVDYKETTKINKKNKKKNTQTKIISSTNSTLKGIHSTSKCKINSRDSNDSTDSTDSSEISDIEDDNYVEKISKLSNKPLEETIKKKEPSYIFHLPDDVIIIFDEAHRCKNMTSATNKLLIGLSKCKNKIIILSATITDKVECFRPFGLFFGFYDEPRKYKLWLNNKFKALKYDKYKTNILTQNIELDIIHNAIFPNYGSRMKIKELGGLFPSNSIAANCYYMENHNEVEEIYAEINDALRNLSDREKRANQLAKITYARMKIEMLKVSLYIDLATEGIENNYSVVIFVNYKNTMDYIGLHMDKHYDISYIMGGQSIEERQNNIDNFQNNRSKLMVAMIQAGGVGISLHDIHGNNPRMSIISPPFAGDIMRQCLGRIHRAGSKTPAIQKIVYIAKTYEENICQIIKRKLTTIDAINNGDLIGSSVDIDKEAFDIINNKTESQENSGIEYAKSAKSTGSIKTTKIIKSKKDTNTKL